MKGKEDRKRENTEKFDSEKSRRVMRCAKRSWLVGGGGDRLARQGECVRSEGEGPRESSEAFAAQCYMFSLPAELIATFEDMCAAV